MGGWSDATLQEQCSSSHGAKRRVTDAPVDVVVSGGTQLQITRHAADRSQLLQSGFELAPEEPFVCPIEVGAFEAWLNMADARQMETEEAVELLKVADFLIDKSAVEQLCMHLADELFNGSPITNKHRLANASTGDGVVDITTAVPEHLLVTIISCAHSLDAVFAGLPTPYHLLALSSYCPDIINKHKLDISSETLEATRCALVAAEGRLSHLSHLSTQVFAHTAAGWGALQRFISPLRVLVCLEVTSHDPSNADFSHFCVSLPPTLRRLRLTGAPLFNPSLVLSLQRALTRLHGLCELSLTHGSLTPDAARILAACMYASLRHCLLPALSSVSLAHNEIGQQGWEALAPALATLPALRLLNLDAASRSASLRPMVTRECPLVAFSNLHYLDISHTFEDDPAWDGVADPFGTVGTIQWLPKHSWLSGLQQFRAAAVTKGRFLPFLIARLATAAGHMQRVDLSASPVFPALSATLARGLARWPYLRSLELRACQLSPDTVASLATQLPRLSWLQVLDVSSNPLGPEGAVAVLAGLAAAGSAAVQTLRLGAVACCASGDCAALAAQVAHGATRGLRQLHSLSLASNSMHAADATAIAPALAALPALAHLDLSGNPLGEGGAAAVLRQLRGSTPVLEVVLRETGLAEDALVATAARAPAGVAVVWD